MVSGGGDSTSPDRGSNSSKKQRGGLFKGWKKNNSKSSAAAGVGGDNQSFQRNRVAIDPQQKVPMYVDSTCAMQMVKQGTGSFKRAKHIKVRYFWLKELTDSGLIELIYVPTDELVADILTKPLTGWKFQYLLRKLLGWNIEMHHGGDINEEVC